MIIRSPLEQFEVVEIVGIRMSGIDISITNVSIMLMIVGSIIVVGIRMITMEGRGRIISGRWGYIVEGMYKLVVGMVYESVGGRGGEYVGIMLTIFMFILISNLVGLVPYSYTVTAQLVITLTLSLGVWIGKLIVGVRNHGVKILGMFIPSGAPFEMVPFFVLLEIIGFIIPLISLAVRLFANMMSGHILLKVLFGFAWSMLIAGGVMTVVHLVPLSALFLLIGLETAVAMIQAYVFTLLTCIYIGDMVKGGH